MEPSAAHQRGGLGISNESVVLQPLRHGSNSASQLETGCAGPQFPCNAAPPAMLPMIAFLMVTIMNDAAQRLIGIVGLGKTGGGIARHALQLGLRVVGFDKKPAGLL